MSRCVKTVPEGHVGTLEYQVDFKVQSQLWCRSRF